MISMHIPAEVSDLGREAIDLYRKALPHGEKWALMVATQTPPGTKGTDRAFLEGRQNNQQLDELPKLQAKYMVREARQAGINISGKHYVAGLADRRGWKDPAAWVSSTDDILRVARKRRLNVSGSVNHDPAPEPKRPVVLSESIIRDEMRKELRRNPRAPKGELRERIIEKHAYKVKGRL
jgi:post-segregation antitoxin (ccd killing protein)